MPTTLPARSRDSVYGRKRQFPGATAILMMWAVAMLTISVPGPGAPTRGVALAYAPVLP